ncbi:hypothetical protein [Brevibacillus porteri]|uniref:DUF4878 domain-containing protein n=1 Tax=Brevibacillus porteri TaxID=2126350 RepID=A0ABX5FHV9_9BACL|nr:hypothetical protein [Brevibacillus porteri]MED1801700.1 hypothetical protein [Brevibacillus porteri]MED2135280.1 hypothetical protein [Brevibacillus porteri]MED2748007.1 hypothetical protein [Brevibacillus porteri]MED2813748.1 hypothetical protein [Brevibacillus porteri]MED2894744.1 hypothetical protein [Brevibacillus porteri]
MYKKATFALAGIGALLLVGNSASAAITRAESYVAISKLSDEEAKKEAQAFDNLLTQRANEIAADTGIDLSGYARIEKVDVWEMDKGLFKEVRELTKTEVGDKMPQIYLHESCESLYILRQYADGTNTAVEFVLENGKWEKK